ncbi:MAG TPA: glycoside hydrolase family 43 protein, partial [Pseudoxanthomonas sp.]|nr:glycoside hydrolase family 43 protein [Pseudoxanthomonas sp.]
GVAAGLAAYQNETHWYFLGVRRQAGKAQLFLERNTGGKIETIADMPIAAGTSLKLKIAGNAGAYSFAYDADGKSWRLLRQDEAGTLLSTDVAGGFVGATLGPYARSETSE